MFQSGRMSRAGTSTASPEHDPYSYRVKAYVIHSDGQVHLFGVSPIARRNDAIELYPEPADEPGWPPFLSRLK